MRLRQFVRKNQNLILILIDFIQVINVFAKIEIISILVIVLRGAFRKENRDFDE